MGGAVSAGADNDELIDNLLEADYIKTAIVERVFRSVDRGHYFTVDYKESAYRDLAWKYGNLHISAPCIYSEVMENLKLSPGMSFLNLGSGTGYLSTMAGLILGSYGVNHGIEIHEDVVDYATKRLEEFISTSSAIDEYEFCQPKFVYGNCLYLESGARQYDRVYCGAACPENHENYMKNLIKVGGILVMPINDQLLQICRTSDTNWESKSVLPVSFATLVSGKMPDCSEPLKMPDTDPLSLQDICRFVVRSILRRNIDMEHPELKRPPRVPRKRVKKKTFHQLVFPIFNSNSDWEDEQDAVNLEDDELPALRRRGFLMDVTNVQTCRSVMELSQILQGPSAPLNDVEPTLVAETPSQGSSVSPNKEDTVMEEDSNFGVPQNNSNENIFEEMTDEEFLPEFEDLHNILAKAETSSSTIASDGEKNEESVEFENSVVEKQNIKPKSKREKIDSGIVDDIETGKEDSSESEHDDNEDVSGGRSNRRPPVHQCPFLKVTDSDSDTENCEGLEEKIEKKKMAAPQSPPINVINYTTYMKEKIKMLPLPMTLKYFLNLNREL